MNEADNEFLQAMLKAMKAVVSIGEGRQCRLVAEIPYVDPDDNEGLIVIESWLCGKCDEIHTLFTIRMEKTFNMVEDEDEPDEQ